METKICNICKIEMEATRENFYKEIKCKSGLKAICKKCSHKKSLEWRNNNKEKKAKMDHEYYLKNKESLKEYYKEYYISNKESIIIQCKEYRLLNIAKSSQDSKVYRKKNSIILAHKKHLSYLKNKETISSKVKAYRKDNIELVRKWKRRSEEVRRSKVVANRHSLSYEDWDKCLEHFNNECCYCGCRNTKLEQEHFVPVFDDGSYTTDNILPSCGVCNRSKSAKDFFVWYKSYEYYNKKREVKILKYLNYKNNTQQLMFDIEGVV